MLVLTWCVVRFESEKVVMFDSEELKLPEFIDSGGRRYV